MLQREEFEVLDDLRKTGALPNALERRFQKLRRAQFFRAGLMCDQFLPSLPSVLTPDPDMSIADWLRAKWTTADEAVRHSLRALATKLRITLPLTRTRRLGVSDSSPMRRTRSARHTSLVVAEPLASASENDEPKERHFDDPPEWDDEDAAGWESVKKGCLWGDPDDRGWY